MLLPAIMLLIQSAGPPAPGLPAPDVPKADLAVPAAAAPDCATAATKGQDIVVCGRPDQEQFRLRPLPPRYVQKGPGIEKDLGNGAHANSYVEQGATINGVPDKRIMVSITLPF